jgi:hypothetical protein
VVTADPTAASSDGLELTSPQLDPALEFDLAAPDRDPSIPDPSQFSEHYGRSTRRYKRLRAAFRKRCEEHHEPCWLNGAGYACDASNGAIDYTLPASHPMSFSLDHAIPRAVRVDLAEDPANFRAAHRLCNDQRGARAPDLSIGVNSEPW